MPDGNGLFNAIWYVGEETFGSDPLWLELGVRRAGTSNAFTILAPRQKIRPVPTSLHAQSADVATSLAGGISSANLPANVARLDATLWPLAMERSPNTPEALYCNP